MTDQPALKENGTEPATIVKRRRRSNTLFDAAKEQTVNEPVQAASVPLTVEERIQRTQQAIQVALEQNGTTLVPSWIQVSQTQQVRSETVGIQAIEGWKQP